MLSLMKYTAYIVILSGIFIQSCKTPAVIATQTIQRADEFNNQGNFKEAIVYYEKYIQLAPGLGVYRNQPMEADVFRKLAHAYSARLNYDSSLYYLHKALEIDSVFEPDPLNIIEDYRKIGLTYGYIGDYIRSIKYLEESLKLNSGMDRSIKDVKRISIGDTYLSLARVNFVIGNFQEAEQDAFKAISIYRKIENEYLGLLESYLLLGKIRIEEGNIINGLSFIESSLHIAEEKNINTSRHYQAIGSAFIQESKYEEALKNRLEALSKAEETAIIPQIIWMNVKVGDVYSYIGDDKKAESYYNAALSYTSDPGDEAMLASPSLQMRLGDVQQAHDLYIKSGSLTGTALASLKLGTLSEKDNKLENAENYFNKSDSIFKIIGSNTGQIASELGLCRIFINNNQLSRASNLISRINNLSKNPEIEWQILFEKGRIYERRNNVLAAYHEYSKSIEIIEKIRGDFSIEEFRSAYMKDKMHVYERLIMLLIDNIESGLFADLEQPAVETAFYFAERARARSFLDILGNTKINSKQSSDTVLLDKEFKLRLQIQKVSKEIESIDLNKTDPKELLKYLDKLNHEYIRMLDLLKLSNNDYKSLISVEPSRLSEIQKLITAKDAVIEYWIGEKKLVIWVITNNNITSKIFDTGAGIIEEMVSNYRRLIGPGSRQRGQHLLTDLYNILISPIESEIDAYESLHIIPHRSLHFLPFQALIDVNGSFLIEKYDISYAPSSSVLRHCSLKKHNIANEFLGMALGDISLGNFSSLPGTKAELKQIIQLYPGASAKYENEASETYLKTMATNYNILHLATHGLMDSKNPLNSYLLMSSDKENDGKLTVNEIFDLNLDSKLVVLSACETGLGHLSKGDELIGLSRAFIYAGTPAIIVSLWQVEDASTALLMTKLHQYYSAGYKIQDALNNAQRDLINNNIKASIERGESAIVWDKALNYEIESGNKAKAKNPFFWAPFVLIGFGEL